MRAHFFLFTPERQPDALVAPQQVVWLEVTGHAGADVVSRAATPEDAEGFRAEYEAFKSTAEYQAFEAKQK